MPYFPQLDGKWRMAAVFRGGWDVSRALCKKERLEVLMNALQSLPQIQHVWLRMKPVRVVQTQL